ncbi:beta-glucosidase BglX [Duganella radicis]|uniref:beta-glucosidase n=1 Tax=Duganella radicis TaxID=551988 RepID=A0A6L6PD70_9BURK|nr:beta-glucosidase BglX [Duganella radicis]MTV36295.1 beta-glucosidase BglX [Duganella radicis]
MVAFAFSAIAASTPASSPAPEPTSPAIFSPATLARTEVLLRKMNLDEKLGQLNQLFQFRRSSKLDDMVRAGKLGSVLFVTDPAEINRLQHLAVEGSRWGIPLLFGSDVVHGYKTIFPVPIALAASWDRGLVERVSAIAATEARADGIAWTFAPMVDVARDPRWGRIVEGAGEDAYLNAIMAEAQVRGFQGPRLGTPGRLLATVKHFAGYGASEGGRDHDAANLSDAQLHNVYLPPFRAAVKAGVGSIMSAYMDLNDVPATGNRWLLRDVLRDEWQFGGFVVSDNNAVNDLEPHGFAGDKREAAVRAFKAGVNMEMASYVNAYAHLREAVDQGTISAAEVDIAVRPILATKIELGLFEQPYIDQTKGRAIAAQASAYQAEARTAAERSAVLLRNEGKLLPLDRATYRRVALIGPLADARQDTLGPWVFAHDLKDTVTVAQGLRAKLANNVAFDIAPGVQLKRTTPSPFASIFKEKTPPTWDAARAADEFDKAVALANSADVVVLALGEKQDMIGESASRSTLALPGDQQRLMERVVASGKPVVLLLMNGRPLDLTWASTHVPAILELWYPGAQGGAAAANLLFGDASPGGKLPFTWPRNVGQIPLYYGHNLTQDPSEQDRRYWNEPSSPLFPFGYGLSYSSFSVTDLRLSKSVLRAGDSLEATAVIENTGAVTADQVVQLYIHQRYGSASRPARELKGFERVTLRPAEKKTVRFTLGPGELGYWSAATRSQVNEASTFDVWVGTDAKATLTTTFEQQ